VAAQQGGLVEKCFIVGFEHDCQIQGLGGSVDDATKEEKRLAVEERALEERRVEESIEEDSMLVQ
jgi:hypothetical protein